MKHFVLRPYQQEAVDRTLEHFRKTDAPAVIVLPTGAGKSLVIAELAKLARKKILVLAHVKELVEQNHEKYCSFNLQAGIFSAGLGLKETDYQVTFASIQSIARNLDQLNQPYSLLIIDECHRLSEDTQSQYGKTIEHLRSLNPHLKVLGLTATPYRMGLGWIYQYHYRGMVRSESAKPFFKCIYELPLRYMISHAYLTPPKVIDATVAHYDFSSLTANARGEYETKALNSLLTQYQRVTQAIIEQVIELSNDRQGVMIFAASVKHAEEIFSYLPSSQTALITGETDNSLRDDTIMLFKQKQIKYLVNVSVLTTGFDAPHVDLIAILRPTQSLSLYQQIIGRGLRLSPNKQDCLVIDYTGNSFDLYHPEVGEAKPTNDSTPVQVFCPACGFANIFWGKSDDNGHVIEHFGRRCQHFSESESGKIEQCSYRFRFKSCPHCGAENDIAARECHQCHEMLTDPDDMLKKALSLKDAKVLRCSGMSFEIDDPVVQITYYDEDGETLKDSFNFKYKAGRDEFNHHYSSRRINQLAKPFTSIAELRQETAQLKAPDFVIARKHGKYWRVKTRIFDYQGRYRKAHQLN
jgi:DNA repair protein RadD